MRRRTVLATVPTLLVGCLGAIDGKNSATTRSAPTTTEVAPTTVVTTTTITHETTEPTTETTNATTTEPSYDLIPAEPASMPADEVRTRLADRDSAELTDLPANCPDDDARLDVSVSLTVGALSGEAVEVTIENRADNPFKWGRL